MKGSCLCGGVEFEVASLSGNIYQCHCTLCRKQGGSSSNTGTVVPMNQLTWLKGEGNIKTWVKDTGFTSSFCDTCGSLVPNLLRKLEYYWLPIGTLDHEEFKVVANLYIDSKASWAVVSPDGERFDTMPDVNDFIAILGNELHA